MLIALCVRVRGKSLKSSHMEPKYKRREPELQDNCARLKRLQQNAMKKKKKGKTKAWSTKQATSQVFVRIAYTWYWCKNEV